MNNINQFRKLRSQSIKLTLLPLLMLTVNLLLDSQTIDTFNGQPLTINLIAGNDNIVVKSPSDFPKPFLGVITLAANAVYKVTGTVFLTDEIDLNGSTIVGRNKTSDKLVYSANSGELFTGSNGGRIFNLTISSPARGTKLFNMNGRGTMNRFILDHTIVSDCDNVGFIKGFKGGTFFPATCFTRNPHGVSMNDIAGL
jgi:hypothetical protein